MARSPHSGPVRTLKRTTELIVVFVLFPVAVYLLCVIAFAVSIVGLVAYVGALLAVWLLFAYVVPLGTGIMTFDEVLAGIRSRRRRESHFEGEPLPEDRALGELWKPGDSD
jgi:hypothetical protein